MVSLSFLGIAQASPQDGSSGNTSIAEEPNSANITADSTQVDSQNSGTETSSPRRKSRFSVGEELILSLSVNELELASVFVVKSERDFRIGLGDFFQIIEFPIYVDLPNVSAEGWYLREDNHFALSQTPDGHLKVQLNDAVHRVERDDYRVEADDLYVEIEDVVQWFGFSYTLNEERLQLNIESPQPFPVEQRLARLQHRHITTSPQNRAVLPGTGSQYQWWSAPLADVQVSVSDNPYGSHTSYSILARQDLLRFNTELFLAGNDQKDLNAAWLTLSRQSLTRDLLGPLRASEYSLGDVTPINSGFGQTQAQSLGFSLSNVPLNRLADSRKTNLTGEIQVGWDAELYRNGLLISQALNIADGRYEFNDIELDFGNNDFEIILYGPQGQIETRTESVIVDSNTTRAGEFHYRFSQVDRGESVFNLNNAVEDPTQQGLESSAAFDLGITQWLSITSGFSWFEPEEGDPQSTYMLRANTSLGGWGLADLGVLGDSDDRHTLHAGFRTRFLGTSYSAAYRQTERPDVLTGETVNHSSINLSMTGRLFANSRAPFSYQNTWQVADTEHGSRQETFQNAIGINTRWGSFNNSLTWYKQAATQEDDPLLPIGGTDDLIINNIESRSLIGGVHYRKHIGRTSLRVFNNYLIKPEAEVHSFGGALNIRWTPNVTSDLRYSRYRAEELEQWNLGLSWHQKSFRLTASGAYNSDEQWSVGLTARFSLGYEPMQRRMFTSGRPIAQSGAVAVRVFEDRNMSGAYDEGEPLLEDVTVKAVQGYRRAETNQAGIAVITPLFDSTETDIVVDEDTLDGPFMIRTIPGVSVVARRGFLEVLELPVARGSELEGYVHLTDEQGEEQPGAYVMLNLVNADGETVASTRTEYDGFYLFTNVLPGKYRLAVDPGYIERRNLRTVADRPLHFSSEGEVLAGVDFKLMPLEAADGYVAVAGRFDSAAMLKLYFQILRKTAGKHFVQQPFYIRPADSGQYTLGVAYYERGDGAEEQAQNACERLLALDLNCDVAYHQFQY